MKKLKRKTEAVVPKQKEKLFVGLGSCIDVSRWDSFSSNDKFQQLQNPNGLVYFEVESLKAASELVNKFIKAYNLGSSSFDGGYVIDENMNFKAKVSYNGRVWDNEDWRVSKEIELC
jgi:hypothetical protein